MINDVDKEGIGMIDIQSMFDAVKAAWVPRLVNAEKDDLWNIIAQYYLRYDQYDNYILKCNFVCKNSFSWLYDIPAFYQEVLLSFNKAKSIDENSFYNDIFQQPIWANQFVNVSEKNKTKVLYYKSWIDAGVLYIGNLKFIEGRLDEYYVYDMVENKSNILVEIMMLKEALKPYRQMLGNHEPVHNIHVPLITFKNKEIFRFKNCKSKPFYRNLLVKKVETNVHEVYWKNCLDIDDDSFKKCYHRKIVKCFDKKLAEFNFKILHNILPCNSNLKKWKKFNDENCRLCKEKEDIKHLLYTCMFSYRIWCECYKKNWYTCYPTRCYHWDRVM